MSLVTLNTAKAHLRVTSADEDSLIQALIDASELLVVSHLGRSVFASPEALTAAIAAVPATLATASETYEAAQVAAYAITNTVESEAALQAAGNTYRIAQDEARRIRSGMVINYAVQAGILLLVGHLYANREATTQQVNGYATMVMPMGVDYVLQPFKVYA